jgi:hypothetical protein
LQELDFFEMSQSKSVGPDEREQAAAAAAATAAAAAVIMSSQSDGTPAVAVSIPPTTTSSSSPVLPPPSAPRYNRIILSSSTSDDDDDDLPLVTSSVPRPSARMSIVPVDAQGGSSVLSQPLTIGTPPHPSSPPPAAIVSRDLRRMSVANGEKCVVCDANECLFQPMSFNLCNVW